MPHLRRLPRSPFWIAGFTLPDGRRTNRSTKTTSRKLAMKLAEQWEDAARRRITEAQARRVLSDIHEQVHGSRLITASVSGYLEQWLGRKKVETSAVTFSSYRHAASDFVAFLGDKAAQPIHYVTTAQIAAWRDSAAQKASPQTANNKLKILRVLFQSAWRDGLLLENAAAKVQKLKAPSAERRPFTLPELKSLLAVASPEWRGMILAGLYTGQRLKDIATLTWAGVDTGRNEIRLATSKTGRRQVIPIANALATYFAELPAGDDPTAYIFPKSARSVENASGRVGTLSNQFYDIMVAAGLAETRAHQKKKNGRSGSREASPISFHVLRHTATSLLKMAGVAEAVARDIIGHESAAISRHYTHVDEDAKRAALAKLPDLTTP